MGTVYLVHDQANGAEVALKALNQELANAVDAEEHRLRFQQEYRAIARLSHPNICQTYDYGTLPDGRPYLTMEYIDGQGLDEATLPLSAEEIAPLLRQLGAALSYVHQQGLVHLDLKPENLRLTRDGVLKLMDFGLMGHSGQVLPAVRGTLAYLAPETARLGPIDARADQYSLAILLFQFTVGELPFRGDSPLALLKAHLSEAAPPLAERAPHAPPALARAIDRMLAKNPGQRFASVEAVLDSLGMTSGQEAALPLFSPPLVGRRSEIHQLMDAVADLTTKRQGQALALQGEAGTGKTRLLEDVRVQAMIAGQLCLSTRARSDQPPYAIFTAWLRQALPVLQSGASGELSGIQAPLSALLPELRPKTPIPRLEPDAARVALEAAIIKAMHLLVAQAPCLCLVEDMQHLDGSSRALLERLCQETSELPLLVLGSSREPPLETFRTLPLRSLEVEDCRALIGGVLGLDSVSAGFAETLSRHAGGNPAAVIVSLQKLVETGVIVRKGHVWELPHLLHDVTWPALATDSWLDRLPTLTAAEAQLAEFAALVAGPFSLATARRCLELSDQDLLDAVESLRRAGWLDQRENLYELSAVTLQRSLYERIPAERRQAGHAEIARQLEPLIAPELQGLTGQALQKAVSAQLALGDIALLAHHHVRGPLDARAARWGLLAAEGHLAVLALEAAEDLLERVIAALPEGPQLPMDPHLRFDAHNLMATCLHWRHDLPRAKQHIEWAEAETASRLDPHRELELLVTTGKYHSLNGNSELALTYQQQASSLARTLDRHSTGLRADINRGRALFFLGRLEEAQAIFSEARTSARELGWPGYQATAASFLGYLRASQAVESRDEGRSLLNEAIAIQEAQGDKSGLVYSLNLAFEVQLLHGRLLEAEATCRKGCELAREIRAVDDYIVGLLNQAIANWELGRLEDAASRASACLEVATAHQHVIAAPIACALLGLVRAVQGQLDAAQSQAHRALAQVQPEQSYTFTLAGLYVAETLLLAEQAVQAAPLIAQLEPLIPSDDDSENRIRLLLVTALWQRSQGQWSEALHLTQRALRGAERLGAPCLVARAALQHAELQAKGEPDRPLTPPPDLEALRQLGGVLYPLLGHLTVAEALRVDGQMATAAEHFTLARELATEMGAPRYQARAEFGLFRTLAKPEERQAALQRAQSLLNALCENQSPDLRRALSAHPEILEILESTGREAPTREHFSASEEATFTHLQGLHRDLQGISIQYERLFQEWTRQTHQLERLNALARQINDSLSLTSVLEHSTKLALELTQAQRGLLFLKAEDDARPPDLMAAFDSEARPLIEPSYSASLLQQALTSGEVLSIADIGTDEQLLARASIAGLNLRSVLCVPLLTQGETLGALYLDSQAQLSPFMPSDLSVVEAIAAHTAVAIRNARLFEEKTRRAAELERVIAQYRRVDFDAGTCHLTGLRNRRFLEEVAERECQIARRYQRPLSVLTCELAPLTPPHQNWGQAGSDAVLRAVGCALAAACRAMDTPARWDDTTFAVLCPDTRATALEALALRLQTAISALQIEISPSLPPITVSASFGLADFLAEDASSAPMFDKAQRAMRQAQRQGKPAIVCWQHPSASQANL